MSPRTIVAYCGLLMSIGAFSIDITLPSFPDIEADLGTGSTLVQWTITIFVLAAGIGQLFWGCISDRFGRKPALAAGLLIFLAGCLLASIVTQIGLLLTARALQGFGAAVAMVNSRAIIRDLYSGDELARSLALASAIFAAGPIFAPLAGGLVAELSGWRMVFVLLSMFCLAMLLVLFWLPETHRAMTPDATRFSTVMRRSMRLMIQPQSRHFLVFATVTNSSMILILAGLPVIYDVHFGVAGFQFAIFFALHGLGIIIGQIANRRIISSRGPVTAMILGGFVLVLSAVLILIGGLTGIINAYSMTALLVLFATSYLLVYSNSTAMVLDPHGDMAGFAASYFGFVTQIGAAIIASAAVAYAGDSIVGFGAFLLAICLISLLGSLWWRVRRKEILRAT